MSAVREETGAYSLRLAPMSPLISVLTIILLALPIGFALSAVLWIEQFAIPAGALIAIYAWVWLRFRPSAFTIRGSGLEVVWPLKRREIQMADITDVRVMDSTDLGDEIGWRIRIGAGGLWGVFGWLKTGRRGIVQTYITRFDRMVWIECGSGRPWLITPDEPDDFASRLLSLVARRA